MLEITPTLSLPESELSYAATRSQGPGGQHVNKTSSRIELTWNLETSSIPDDVKSRLRQKLATRLDSTGTIRVTCSTTRSQHRNKDLATEKFCVLLSRSLEEQKPRIQTAPTPQSKTDRLDDKRRHSEKKQLRRPPSF